MRSPCQLPIFWLHPWGGATGTPPITCHPQVLSHLVQRTDFLLAFDVVFIICKDFKPVGEEGKAAL